MDKKIIKSSEQHQIDSLEERVEKLEQINLSIRILTKRVDRLEELVGQLPYSLVNQPD